MRLPKATANGQPTHRCNASTLPKEARLKALRNAELHAYLALVLDRRVADQRDASG
jgi:hypothetical protein